MIKQVLAIYFLINGTNLGQALASYSKCETLFNSQEIRSFHDPLSQLSPESRWFWKTVGDQIQQALDSDFRRQANRDVYREHIYYDHPAIEFYRSIGFEIRSDGTLKSPTLPRLFSLLNQKVEKLNDVFAAQGETLRISTELLLDLKASGDDINAKHVRASPLSEFFDPHMKLLPKSGLLNSIEFYQYVAGGKFPIGNTENAIGAPRDLLEQGRKNPKLIEDLSDKPNISDFLHDLSHISVFINNPDFALAYFKVYRSYFERVKALPLKEQEKYISKITSHQEPGFWWRTFYFSESSWIPHKNFQREVGKLKELSALLNQAVPPLHSYKKLRSSEILRVREELSRVYRNWWSLFTPLGGATHDMISYYGLAPWERSAVINLGVRNELKRYLESSDSLPALDSLEIVLNFLKHSPKFTVQEWTTFAKSDNWTKTPIFLTLQEIFPQKTLDRMPDWDGLADFLYPEQGP